VKNNSNTILNYKEKYVTSVPVSKSIFCSLSSDPFPRATRNGVQYWGSRNSPATYNTLSGFV